MDEDNDSLPVGFDCQTAAAMVTQRLEELGPCSLRSFDTDTAVGIPRLDVPSPQSTTEPDPAVP